MATQTGGIDLKAMKKAHEQALAAAEAIEQYFWYLSGNSTEAGAHITEVPQDEFTDPTSPNYQSGGNLLARSNGIAVRNGLKELATFGADGQAFYNDNNFSVFGVGKTETITVTRRIEDVFEYNNESTIDFELSWNCNSITGIVYYDSSYTSTSIAPTYTINGRVISYDTAACDTMRNSNVKYINVLYTGTGRFPHITFGQRGVGEIGVYSSAEGVGVVASGMASHAEGVSTRALAYDSHSEGIATIASGENSHAEGIGTQATKDGAHAEGWETVASGVGAHSGGRYTVADQQSQTAVGVYNTKNNTNNLFVVGNGEADNARSDALAVYRSGNVKIAGGITAGGHTQEIGFFGRSAGSYSCPSNTNYHNTGYNTPATSDADCLNAGTWLLVAHVTFPSNNTGRRTIRIYNVTTSSEIGRSVVTRTATQGATTQMIATCAIQITAKNQYRVDIMQNSGSTASCDVDFTWTRIA